MNEYKRSMDALRFSEEQKEAMTDWLVQAQQAPSVRRRRPLRRMAVMAAVAALTLAIGAGATVLRLASQSFAPLFGTEQAALIDELGYPLGVSATQNGITVTADAILGDQNHLEIMFSVGRADGKPLPQDSLDFADVDVGLHEEMANGMTDTQFLERDPDDPQAHYLIRMYWIDDSGVPEGVTRVTFHDLVSASGTAEQTTVAEGDWTLTFDVRYADTSVELVPVPLVFDNAYGTVRVNSLRLSPLGAWLSYEYLEMDADIRAVLQAEQIYADWCGADVPPTQAEQDARWAEIEAMPGYTRRQQADDLVFTLRLKDGTTRDLSCDSLSTVLVQDDTISPILNCGVFADAVIPLTDMECVVVEGQTLALP